MILRGVAGRRPLIAAIAGAVGASGLAPFGLWPLTLLSVALICATFTLQSRPRGAFVLGWVFGLGYFAHALIWIVEPFLVDVARHGWMAPFALLLLSGGLALFWGAAFAGARVLAGPAPGLVALVALWSLAETLRGVLFTGFAWAGLAQIWVGQGTDLVLQWTGQNGLTLLTLAVCALPAIARTWPGRAALALPALMLAGGGAVGMALLPPVVEGAVRVRLVQPNAAQHLKWDPGHMQEFHDRLMAYTGAPGDGDVPDLIVWPETALPVLLENAARHFTRIAQAAGGAHVALGLQRSDALGYRNSIAVIAPDGKVSGIYDKHHLVPFGEYFPLAGLAGRLGLRGLAERAGGYVPGPGPTVLGFGPAGRGLALICYEGVFARNLFAPERPDFLILLTNDAWFGKFSGPYQHLAQARMRAIEQGLAMVRAANTGVSAVIDPFGRIVGSIGLGRAGFVDLPLPAPRAATFYARYGEWPFRVVLALLIAAAVFWTRIRRAH